MKECMPSYPASRKHLRKRLCVQFFASVERVPEEWVPQMSHVHADLMRPACVDRELGKGKRRFHRSARL